MSSFVFFSSFFLLQFTVLFLHSSTFIRPRVSYIYSLLSHTPFSTYRTHFHTLWLENTRKTVCEINLCDFSFCLECSYAKTLRSLKYERFYSDDKKMMFTFMQFNTLQTERQVFILRRKFKLCSNSSVFQNFAGSLPRSMQVFQFCVTFKSFFNFA